MNRSLRFIGMTLTLVALVLCSAVLPPSIRADEPQQEESVTHVEWSATEQEWEDFKAQLKGLDVQEYEDGAAPYADAPVTESWTSKEMSAQDLAEWVKSQPSQNLADRCTIIRIKVRIVTRWGDIIIEVIVRICDE